MSARSQHNREQQRQPGRLSSPPWPWPPTFQDPSIFRKVPKCSAPVSSLAPHRGAGCMYAASHPTCDTPPAHKPHLSRGPRQPPLPPSAPAVADGIYSRIVLSSCLLVELCGGVRCPRRRVSLQRLWTRSGAQLALLALGPQRPERCGRLALRVEREGVAAGRSLPSNTTTTHSGRVPGGQWRARNPGVCQLKTGRISAKELPRLACCPPARRHIICVGTLRS